jgi:hypothetical protein
MSEGKPMTSGVGVGLRACHYRDFLQQRPVVDWLEVHTENYLQKGGLDRYVLFELRQHYPISLHGVGLGLGSAQGFSDAHLQQVRELADQLQPFLVSEHLCWGAVADRNLNDLLPLPLSWQALDLICQRVDQVQEALRRPILLENVSTYLRYRSDAMGEIEFLAAVAQRTGCQVLLDVNNLYVNQCNQQESAIDALAALPMHIVGEIHLAGHTLTPEVVIDDHGARVAAPVWDLYRAALQRFGAVPTLIEWDTDIPPLAVLLGEADIAREMVQQVTQINSPIDAIVPKNTLIDESSAASLAQIQTQFASAMISQHAPDCFRGDQAICTARFSRYRGNMIATWEKTLAAAFPVLQALVGEEFFAALARAYGEAYPSKSGDLNQFGAQFSRFLAEFPHVAQYPYFPDVAALEWHLHRAYYAPDGMSLLPHQLAAYSALELEKACLCLHPACALMVSDWALLPLWQAHQPDSEVAFPEQIADFCQILICRPHWKPQVLSLSAASYAALKVFNAGRSFGEALEAALAHDEEFDVAGNLQQWVALGLLQAV